VKKQYLKIETDNKTLLDAYLLLPQSFDSAKQHPLLIFQYSGPGSQNVTNKWGGSNFIWHQYLATQGYIVAVVDTRGTGYRGEEFKKMTYKQLGKYEVIDQIKAAQYLGSLPFVSKERIGIWGWSYGGYMSSLAMMKGADVFKVGIAVAPVTTWRFYDTVYTERYLQRPEDNPIGYDDNSPLSHVEKLKGKFLLVHGMGDDNVHFQNSVALQDALIKAGKQFSSFYYPDKAHGISGKDTRNHLYQMMTEFIKDNL
jgi:dipeptidyl-peptidase-4